MWHFVIKIFTFFSPLLPYLPYRILFNFSFLNHDNVEASNTAIRFSKFKENFIPPVRCTRKVSTFNEELWFYGKKHQKIGKSQKPLKWSYHYVMQFGDIPIYCRLMLENVLTCRWYALNNIRKNSETLSKSWTSNMLKEFMQSHSLVWQFRK